METNSLRCTDTLARLYATRSDRRQAFMSEDVLKPWAAALCKLDKATGSESKIPHKRPDVPEWTVDGPGTAKLGLIKDKDKRDMGINVYYMAAEKTGWVKVCSTHNYRNQLASLIGSGTSASGRRQRSVPMTPSTVGAKEQVTKEPPKAKAAKAQKVPEKTGTYIVCGGTNLMKAEGQQCWQYDRNAGTWSEEIEDKRLALTTKVCAHLYTHTAQPCR